jgi:uncharacterized protein (DUF779 family)
MTTEEKLRKIHREMPDEQRAALTEYRGGCSCHYAPPCLACSDPLTEEEALELGLIEEVAQ